ncbi:MAG: AbrB/MazE/SpoVT family DNA-binding domain-containing protein [Terriglobales bacterium]
MATYHSTLTRKGQTTVPVDVRRALGLNPGDRIAYEVRGAEVRVTAPPSLTALAGVLASNRGRGMSFAEIRAAAARQARRRGRRWA